MAAHVFSTAARTSWRSPAGRALRLLAMSSAGAVLACGSSPPPDPDGEGGMGGMGGMEASANGLVSMTCPAGGVCELQGLTLFTEAPLAVTFDQSPHSAPGGYAVVPGFPSVQIGLTGHPLSGHTVAVFDLGDLPRSGDLVVVLDSGDGPTLLLSEFVQETLVAELAVGGKLALLRIVPDLPSACSETWHPGGSFDLSNLSELSGVTHIDGDLMLAGSLPGKLDTLSCLALVGGDLVITGGEGLLSLQGLAHLTIVGRGLSVESNPDLVDANLPGLEGRVTGLSVANNPRLESFGAGDLMDVLGPLTIATNGQKASSFELDLHSLRRILGHADFIDNAGWRMDRSLGSLETIEGRLLLLQNDAIETLDDLYALTSVGSDLEIGQSQELYSIDGLANLSSVGANVRIHDNPRLRSVDLSGLSSIPGALSLGHNGSAASELSIELGALEVVHGALDLVYNRHWNLEQGLANLDTVEGDVSIWENSALVSLSGLEALTSIGGGLSINNNGALQEIDLPRLEDIAGGVAIHSEPQLSQLQVAKLASVDGDLILAYNGTAAQPLKLDLGGVTIVHGHTDIVHNGGVPLTLSMAALTAVEGRLSLSDNAGLYGATGAFAALTRVDGPLFVSGNAVLVTVPLPNLVSVGAELDIEDNPALSSLAGLALLQDVGGALAVVQNIALPTCEAVALLDQLHGAGFIGSSVVTGNALDACSP